MLSTLTSLKTLLQISLSDTSQDALLSQLLGAADAAVKSYCDRDFESQSYTHFFSGQGLPDLPLKQRPVSAVASVWLDAAGYYGDGPGAFAGTTLLTAGVDYVLARDFDDGVCSASGLLRRIGGQLWPGSWSPYGTLSQRPRPVWPAGVGNVKVTYTAGYALTPTAGIPNLPADLVHAVNETAVWLKKIKDQGGLPYQGETLGKYSYTLAVQILGSRNPELGTPRGLLAQYRDMNI